MDGSADRYRCHDGVACEDVIAFLDGADHDVAAGFDPQTPAIVTLRQKAERMARVHLAEDAARRAREGGGR